LTPGGGGGGSSTTYLKDNNLNNIQTWSHSNGPASMPYLISGDEPGYENTLLVYPYRVNNPTMESGGVGGAFEVLTWDGDLVWEYELSNNDFQHHHDVEPLPNGNILMIAWEKKTASEAYAAGRQSIDNPLNVMWSTEYLKFNMMVMVVGKLYKMVPNTPFPYNFPTTITIMLNFKYYC
jgi:hypothetical protein